MNKMDLCDVAQENGYTLWENSQWRRKAKWVKEFFSKESLFWSSRYPEIDSYYSNSGMDVGQKIDKEPGKSV